MTMDEQKAFELSYQLMVAQTANYVLDEIRDTAIREEFEPGIFLDDVICKLRALFKKEE